MGRLSPRKRQLAQLTYHKKIRVISENDQPICKVVPVERGSNPRRDKESESAMEADEACIDEEELDINIIWIKHIVAFDQYRKNQQNPTLKIINRFIHLRQYMVARRNGRKAMEASNLIAELSDKGPYYARVIRDNVKTFIINGILPSGHGRPRVKGYLENKDIDHAVTAYLKEYKFTITPSNLKAHLENTIFHILNNPGGVKTIHTETARKWMLKKKWNYGIRKKGVYVDGHEREDVVIYRENFLKEMDTLEESMIMYDDDTLEPIQNPEIESNKQKRYILVTHDESCFHANDEKKYGWAPKGEQPLRRKGLGKGIMVSEFLLDTVGRLAVSEEDYRIIDNPLFPREACEIFEYGRENGYWTSDHMIKQVNIFSV
jgi:hypothetical protein